MDSDSDSEDDEGGEGIGDPEEEQPLLEDPTYRTRSNTPTKKHGAFKLLASCTSIEL
jgi:hypothetical protein